MEAGPLAFLKQIHGERGRVGRAMQKMGGRAAQHEDARQKQKKRKNKGKKK